MTPQKPSDEILEYITRFFEYDPVTGFLYRWYPKRGVKLKCISKRKDRYRVGINKTEYQVTNICWFLYYKQWPEFEVDHEDRSGFNNKIHNLRKSTSSQNAANKDKRIENEYHGVSYHPIGDKWRYRFIVNKIKYEVYGFVSRKEAAIARERHLDQLGDTFCARNKNLG